MKNLLIYIRENKIRIAKTFFVCVNIILLPYNLVIFSYFLGNESISLVFFDFNLNSWFFSCFSNETSELYRSLFFLYLINAAFCYFLSKNNKKNIYWLLKLYLIYSLLFALHSIFGSVFLSGGGGLF